MTEICRLFVGYDSREAAAYHVFCESVIEKASVPVAFYPLHQGLKLVGQRDGSNAFTFSRYLVPYLCDFRGWALFADGDMTCETDIAELWEARHEHVFDKALAVVKHDYSTRNPVKYLGTPMQSANEDYPRKNWSSLILWNCAHYANRDLTPEYVRDAAPAHLHRFGWAKDSQIGELLPNWNHLVGEDPPGAASIYHHTLGVPGIKAYADVHGSWRWHSRLLKVLRCPGQDPLQMVQRSQERIGVVE